jgi:hypothetical protein
MDGGPTEPPTLNVGWLAAGHDFAKGEVSPSFVMRLQELVAHARTRQTRGFHECELCADPNPPGDDTHMNGRNPRLSSAEIRAVGSDGVRYAAPTLIPHYIIEHGYAPPQPFVEAVLRCRHIAWESAQSRQLCMSCGTRLSLDQRMNALLKTQPSDSTIPCFNCVGCATSYWR